MGKDRRAVVLITGASAGIGKACAARLHHAGYCVYGTSRQPVAVPVPYRMISMDVTEDESVQRGIESIWRLEGRLDVVVNNAGITTAGAVEDTSIPEAKHQFETNFFGVLRVCRAALPLLRGQGSGHIINISSIAAEVALPFQGLYSASKAAISGMTEALRMEVKPYGIHVVLIQPGDCRTQVADYRCWAAEATANSAYAERCTKALTIAEADERNGLPPDKVARVIERILNARSPRPRYLVAPPFERFAAVAKRIVPGRLFEWFQMKYYRIG